MNYHKQFQFNKEVTGLFIDRFVELNEENEHVHRWLSHILNALDIWTSRISETKTSSGVWDLWPGKEMHQINEEAHQRIFKILESGNLHGQHEYVNSKGEKFSNSLDEILTHLIIHSAHHRAQIASEWRRTGQDPPVSDFIFWSRS